MEIKKRAEEINTPLLRHGHHRQQQKQGNRKVKGTGGKAIKLGYSDVNHGKKRPRKHTRNQTKGKIRGKILHQEGMGKGCPINTL